MSAASGIGAGLGIGGAGLRTYGQVQQARAEAKGLTQEALSIEAQAAFDEMQQRRQAGLLLGQATAQGAASGVALTSGSPLLLELDRVKQAELEAQGIRRAGQMGAAGKRYGAKLAKASIPYHVLGGLTGGGAHPGAGSILTNYIAGQS